MNVDRFSHQVPSSLTQEIEAFQQQQQQLLQQQEELQRQKKQATSLSRSISVEAARQLMFMSSPHTSKKNITMSSTTKDFSNLDKNDLNRNQPQQPSMSNKNLNINPSISPTFSSTSLLTPLQQSFASQSLITPPTSTLHYRQQQQQQHAVMNASLPPLPLAATKQPSAATTGATTTARHTPPPPSTASPFPTAASKEAAQMIQLQQMEQQLQLNLMRQQQQTIPYQHHLAKQSLLLSPFSQLKQQAQKLQQLQQWTLLQMQQHQQPDYLWVQFSRQKQLNQLKKNSSFPLPKLPSKTMPRNNDTHSYNPPKVKSLSSYQATWDKLNSSSNVDKSNSGSDEREEREKKQNLKDAFLYKIEHNRIHIIRDTSCTQQYQYYHYKYEECQHRLLEEKMNKRKNENEPEKNDAEDQGGDNGGISDSDGEGYTQESKNGAPGSRNKKRKESTEANRTSTPPAATVLQPGHMSPKRQKCP